MNTRELFDLGGRAALVTGGGSGLGRQMALALAEMGADVVVCGRDAARCDEVAAMLSALGRRALGLPCDVTDPKAIQAVVGRMRREFGRIDILVNSAGRAWVAPAATMRGEDWRRVLDVNLTGTFLCCQAVAADMIDREAGGKIINVASIAGLRGSKPELLDSVAYSASKGGVISLTRDLAVKWARHRIYVNAIAPGWFPTRLSSAVLEEWGERLARATPLGRLGGDDDLKGAVAFLASTASDYITGQVLTIDGGLTSQ